MNRIKGVLAEVGMFVSWRQDIHGLRPCVAVIDESRNLQFNETVQMHPGFHLEGIGPSALEGIDFLVSNSVLESAAKTISFRELATAPEYSGNLLRIRLTGDELVYSKPAFCRACKERERIMVRPKWRPEGYWRCMSCGQVVLGGLLIDTERLSTTGKEALDEVQTSI